MAVRSEGGIFYGWWIAILAMLTLFVTNGITLTGITVFDRGILGEFGWARGDLKLRDLITLGLSGLMAPFIGALADRYSVKRLMIAGCLLLAGALGAYSQLQTLRGLYLIHVVIALVLALAGLVLNVVVVARWFIVKRGTALGLTLVGTSLGGTLFPIIGARLLTVYDWRTAMGMEAFFAIGMAVLLAVFLKDRPEEKGLQAFGAASLSKERTSAALDGMEYGEAIRTRTFWILAFCAMTTFYCILGVQSNLVLHLQDLGWALPEAAKAIGILFTMGMLSKFVVGYLADFLDRKLVLIANISVMLVGSLCLASMQSALIWPFIVIFGLGWGGLYTLLQLLCMDSFGVKSGGKILGTITVLDAIGGGLGPFVTGKLFDVTRSYQMSFSIVVGLVALALVAALFLNPPKPAVPR